MRVLTHHSPPLTPESKDFFFIFEILPDPSGKKSPLRTRNLRRIRKGFFFYRRRAVIPFPDLCISRSSSLPSHTL